MRIPKWSKRDLLIMGDKGYGGIPCKDENEVELVYKQLKDNKRCAQVGHIFNKDNEVVFFVCTKPRAERGVNRG